MIIFDTTLRDGVTGRTADPVDMLTVFALIDGLGVDIIEVGLVNRGTRDIEPIRKARDAVRAARVCCLAFPDPDSIARAGAALADREGARIHTFNPVAKDKASLDDIRDTVAEAARYCGDIEWGALDATLAEPDFLCRAVETAIDAGAATVNIADTRGYALPHEMAAMIGDLRDRVPNIDRAMIAVHCHDDLGLATANALAAVSAGAGQVECAINGLGPRGGNTSLQEIIAAVTRRPDAFPEGTKIDPDGISEVSRAVENLASAATGG